MISYKRYLFAVFFSIAIPLFSVPSEVKVRLENVYFSPNFDSVQDIMTFLPEWKSKVKLQDWKLEIKDERQNIIKEFKADLRHKRRKAFVYYLMSGSKDFEPLDIKVPQKIEWNGTGIDGKIPPDGRYSVTFKVKTIDGKDFTSKTIVFYLDATAPYPEISTDIHFFSPNGDKNYDTFTIKQRVTGEPTDRWKGTFYNSKGEEIRSFLWETKNIPDTIRWDGRDDRGILQDAGVYTYKLVGKDFSGNQREAVMEQIVLRKDSVDIDAFANVADLSPNDDKIKDSATFNLFVPTTYTVNSWKLIIYKKDGKDKEIFKSFSNSQKEKSNPEESESKPLPAQITWDGNTNKGKLIKNGTYLYSLELDVGDKKIHTYPRKITVNSASMEISFKINHDDFTPDNDNEKDYLEISPVLKNFTIKNWQMELVEKYYTKKEKEQIKIIKKWKGTGKPADKILWDGIKDDGILIGSLAELDLYFYFTNELDEKKFFLVKSFRTGLLVNYFKNGILKMSVPEYVLSKEEPDVVKKINSTLVSYPGYKVEVQSHSRQPGDNIENHKKTEVRVKDFFKKLFGKEVNFDRYDFRGHGEVEPLFPDESVYHQEKNERIDIVLTKE